MSSGHDERRPLRLAPFLESLRVLLDGLSSEELARRLVSHARTLEPRDREGFLEIFTAPAVAGVGPVGPDRAAEGGTAVPGGRAAAADEVLLADIDALTEEARAGAFFEGWGWDDEIHDQRAWGDESWAPRMDSLFDRAGLALLAGDLELAAEAYRRLFRAFEIEEEEPVFPGASDPHDLLESDLTEAQARFARAIYETAPAGGRPSALLAEVRRTDHLIDWKVGLLRAMEDAREGSLPDFDGFLAGWIEALEGSEEETERPFGWEASRRRLLREAVRRRGGATGLAGLARRSGDPEAFLEWSEVAAREGDLAQAVEALGEGLDGVSKPHPRAGLADRLATVAGATAQWELALSSRRLAWRLEPTRRRLRDLAQVALDLFGADEDLERLMRAELRALQEGDYRAGSDCAGLLEVLAGELDVAERRLAAAPSVGWSSHDHPGGAVFPVLLVAGAGLHQPPEGTILAELWSHLDGSRREWWDSMKDQEEREALAAIGVASVAPPDLSDLVSALLLRRMPGDGQKRAFLETCRSVALGRARHIVSHKFRNAYDRAASAAAACAEGFALAGWPDEGRLLVEGLRQEFPRHSAFKRSLEAHEVRSSVLGALNPPHR